MPPALGSAIRHEWRLNPDFLTVNHGSYGATPLVVQAAQEAGLAACCHLQGGLAAWKAAGGPVEP